MRRTSPTTYPPQGSGMKIPALLRGRIRKTNLRLRPTPSRGRCRTTRSRHMRSPTTASTITRRASRLQIQSHPKSRSKCGHLVPERTITKHRCTGPLTTGLTLHNISGNLPTRSPSQIRGMQAMCLLLMPHLTSIRKHGAATPPRRVLERSTYRRPRALRVPTRARPLHPGRPTRPQRQPALNVHLLHHDKRGDQPSRLLPLRTIRQAFQTECIKPPPWHKLQ